MNNTISYFLAVLAVLFATSTLYAQEHEEENSISLEHFRLEGYGSLNYFNYDWQTDPSRRNALDVEKFVLEPSYIYNDKFRLKTEIEFEHGGTGVTKELDKFEEAGEYENEIEQGGEVKLEQLNIVYSPNDELHFRAGKFKVPFGIGPVVEEPNHYFTTLESPEMSTLIPTNWYSVGLQAFGRAGRQHRLRYTLSLVNGLTSTQFSSANWVARGRQGRFETIRANNFALALRLDYALTKDWTVGVSGYAGNSTDNRPKPDLNADAYVSIIDGHLNLEEGPVTFRAVGLYGHLQNSDLVTSRNLNITTKLNVKQDPVASLALAYYGLLAYDIFKPMKLKGELDLFVRYGFYDSMYRTAATVTDNPRWERSTYTAGINYKPIDDIVLKAQYMHRKLGLADDNIENTFSAGIGFEF